MSCVLHRSCATRGEKNLKELKKQLRRKITKRHQKEKGREKGPEVLEDEARHLKRFLISLNICPEFKIEVKVPPGLREGVGEVRKEKHRCCRDSWDFEATGGIQGYEKKRRVCLLMKTMENARLIKK